MDPDAADCQSPGAAVSRLAFIEPASLLESLAAEAGEHWKLASFRSLISTEAHFGLSFQERGERHQNSLALPREVRVSRTAKHLGMGLGKNRRIESQRLSAPVPNPDRPPRDPGMGSPAATGGTARGAELKGTLQVTLKQSGDYHGLEGPVQAGMEVSHG